MSRRAAHKYLVIEMMSSVDNKAVKQLGWGIERLHYLLAKLSDRETGC